MPRRPVQFFDHTLAAYSWRCIGTNRSWFHQMMHRRRVCLDKCNRFVYHVFVSAVPSKGNRNSDLMRFDQREQDYRNRSHVSARTLPQGRVNGLYSTVR
jgi:hypothetical protein